MPSKISGKIPTIKPNKDTTPNTNQRQLPRSISLDLKPLPLIVSNLADFFLINRFDSQIDSNDIAIKITAST